MKTFMPKLDAFHEKAPYVEIIITAIFGAYVDRFFNKILEDSITVKWYLCASFYVLLVGLAVIAIYYRFFSSIRVRHTTLIDQKKEDLLVTLYDEGKKELVDETKTIAQKVEVYELIMRARRG